jgi:hypothetical protein
MLPSEDCSEDCTPSYLHRRLQTYASSTVILSSIPFILTFFAVAIVVSQKLYPFLSGSFQSNHQHSSSSTLQSPFIKRTHQPITHRIKALTFSTTIGLAAVLAELLLCEISDTLDPITRGLALEITVGSLLLLLIIVTPSLELYSVVSGAGYIFSGPGKGRLRIAWILQISGFGLWLFGFWWIGARLPGTHLHGKSVKDHTKSLGEACLERIGVIGISLMALLSGFASISSPYQNLISKQRHVTESDIARRQAGLEATTEMLAAKRNRLRTLDRKMSEAPAEGFMTRVIGTIRGSAALEERKSLHMEIAGLETMGSSLSSSLSILQHRHANQERARTPSGRLVLLISYIFSFYCLYRILATFLSSIRRWSTPSATFSTSDPIDNVLGLLAKHWDPTIDRIGWSRQVSFLLSGVILLASFNSVLQTFHFFSRFTPGLLSYMQANLALIVGQISATYVISSALLLRSNLPKEVGSVISEALGAPLELGFVDRWFEGWFLSAAAITCMGIFVGKKFSGGGEWDDEFEDGDVEMAKRS